MKFGKNLRESILKEWRFYSVDYKQMKKVLKIQDSGSGNEESESEYEVDKSFDQSCEE